MKYKLYKKYKKRPEIKKNMHQTKKMNAYGEFIKKIIKRGAICL